MQTLEFSLNELIDEGLVEWEDAAAVSLYPKEVHRPEPSGMPLPPLPSAVRR